MNFKVEDKDGAMQAILKALTQFGEPLASYDFDGYRVEFTSWWMNIRKSNTEPYLRLVIEAADDAELEERKQLIIGIINNFVSL
jgi:phosphomannomutase